jgi:hypothetical protein
VCAAHARGARTTALPGSATSGFFRPFSASFSPSRDFPQDRQISTCPPPFAMLGWARSKKISTA